LGGRIAEELFCDDITTGASDDIERLTKMVYKFVTVFGMDTTVGPIHCDWRDKKISKDLRHKIDTAVMEHIDMAYTKARTILSDNKHQIIKLANLLLENETVIKKDFDDLWS